MTIKDDPRLAQYKLQAKRLAEFLKVAGTTIKHTHALEAVAQMHGYKDFHTLASRVGGSTDGMKGGESTDSRFLKAAIEMAMERGEALAIEEEGWDNWHNVVDAHLAGRAEEQLFYARQDAALIAARLATNCFDIEGMAAALPYVDTDRAGYAGERPLAERLLAYAALVEDKLSRCRDDGLRSSFRASLRLDVARYELHGIAAWGLFEEGRYADAAQHARKAAEQVIDDDDCGMLTAAITLAVLAGEIHAASEMAAEDPALGPVMEDAKRLLSGGPIVMTERRRDALTHMQRMAESSISAPEMAKQSIRPTLPAGDWGPLMDAFECNPWLALGYWLKGSPKLQERLGAALLDTSIN